MEKQSILACMVSKMVPIIVLRTRKPGVLHDLETRYCILSIHRESKDHCDHNFSMAIGSKTTGKIRCLPGSKPARLRVLIKRLSKLNMVDKKICLCSNIHPFFYPPTPNIYSWPPQEAAAAAGGVPYSALADFNPIFFLPRHVA